MTDTTAPQTRRLEYRPLAEVQRAPRNPNGHDLPALAASIRRHGFVEPVVIDERTGFLIGGHGRLDVLSDMRSTGEAPPEGIQAAPDDWLLPVILGWSSRSDAEAEALLLSMMKLPKSEVAYPDVLAAMLDELVSMSADALDGTGYSAFDIDLILSELGQAEGPTDANAEWAAAGMPDFQQENRKSKYTTTVHFLSDEDAARFWQEVLGEPKPRAYVWWPKHDGFVGADMKAEWVSDQEQPQP